jgi:lysyl-tRNA synthetase class 2
MVTNDTLKNMDARINTHPNLSTPLRGRLIDFSKATDQLSASVLVRNEAGNHPTEVSSLGSANLGDVVEIEEKRLTVLTPNRTPEKSMKWLNKILDPRRVHGTRVRTQVEDGIRNFFRSQGFHETRTPILVPCPGMEPHIRPFAVKHAAGDSTVAFLPTSPEFAMKRLLVGGLEKIFQISSAFRDEPHSTTHHPEFTMLEWYRAYTGYEQIMIDTENLFESIAQQILGRSSFIFRGQAISVKTPWPRLKVRDLFREWAQVDLVARHTTSLLAEDCARLGIHVNPEDSWDDLYFRIWLNVIEPRLPADQAVFVIRYPTSQAALAVIDTDEDGSRWAKRFEVYAGQLELGNAFEELTEPVEQRHRFVKDMELREAVYGAEFPKNPLDEEFLEALTEGMPPAGGIAVGVDRMVMLFADEENIDYTTWL